MQRASDIDFITDNGIQYARVKVIYYTAGESGSRNKVYEQYTLRQDDDSRWKILYWDVIQETNVNGD